MTKESGINITKAVFPAPFESGLEYNPPHKGRVEYRPYRYAYP